MAGLFTAQNTSSKGSGGKVVPYSQYKSHQALRQKITGAESFGSKVSQVEFEKRVGRELRTKKGETIKARDLHKEVKKIIGKAGSSGISGMRIKQKLKKELGLKFKDADKVIKAATYHLAKPDEGGLTEEDRARILERTKNIHERERTDETKTRQSGVSTDLGVHGHAYKVSAFSGKQISEDDVRTKEAATRAASPDSGAAKYVGSKADSAEPVGSGTGIKEQVKSGDTGKGQAGEVSVKSSGAKIIEMHSHPAFMQRKSRSKDSKQVPSGMADLDDKQDSNKYIKKANTTTYKPRSLRSSSQSDFDDFDPQDLIPANRDNMQEEKTEDNELKQAA